MGMLSRMADLDVQLLLNNAMQRLTLEAKLVLMVIFRRCSGLPEGRSQAGREPHIFCSFAWTLRLAFGLSRTSSFTSYLMRSLSGNQRSAWLQRSPTVGLPTQ